MSREQTDSRLRVVGSRRRMLQTLGAGATVGLAGCGDVGDLFGTDDDGFDLDDVRLIGPDGDQVSLTLMHDPGTGDQAEIAGQIESDLELIGIEMDTMETSNILQELNSEPLDDANEDEFEWGPVGRNAGPPDQTRMIEDYDMLIGIGGNSYPRTPGNTDSFWTREGPVNAYGYVPEDDHASMYADALEEPDQDERQAIFSEIFVNLTEEVPANFLTTDEDWIGFRPDIHTADQYNEFGIEFEATNRYRDADQPVDDPSVLGNYLVLTTGIPQTFYPPEADDTSSAAVIDRVHDGTYAISTDNEIVPLHLDIEDSGDSQVYVCTLRDGLEWGVDEDGDSFGQFTAEDYVFHLEFVHGVADDAGDFWDEEIPPSADVPEFEVVDNVEQTGELEFQIELGSPDASFPLRPIMWGDQCLPQGLYEKYAPSAEDLRESTEVQEFTYAGNLGPYTFENEIPGVSGEVTLTRNEDYYMHDHVDESNVLAMGADHGDAYYHTDNWAEAPFFEQLRLDREEETATINERFRSGEGDSMGLETDLVEEFQEDDEVRTESQVGPFISMLFFNMRSNGHELVSDHSDGRFAISQVVDKEVIAEEIQRGLSGNPAVTYQPEWSEFFDDDGVVMHGVDITEDTILDARDMLDDIDGFSIEDDD